MSSAMGTAAAASASSSVFAARRWFLRAPSGGEAKQEPAGGKRKEGVRLSSNHSNMGEGAATRLMPCGLPSPNTECFWFLLLLFCHAACHLGS